MGFRLTTTFEAPADTHTVIVLVPHYWGKGKTKAEAMANVKKEGGKPGTTGYITYYFGEGFADAWVDGMGGVNWEWTPEAHAAHDTGIHSLPFPVKEEVGL